jgi:hypothetical protein
MHVTADHVNAAQQIEADRERTLTRPRRARIRNAEGMEGKMPSLAVLVRLVCTPILQNAEICVPIMRLNRQYEMTTIGRRGILQQHNQAA